jgi:hypothetical protein
MTNHVNIFWLYSGPERVDFPSREENDLYSLLLKLEKSPVNANYFEIYPGNHPDITVLLPGVSIIYVPYTRTEDAANLANQIYVWHNQRIIALAGESTDLRNYLHFTHILNMPVCATEIIGVVRTI